ncbi:MAG: class I SAM-dependent methyltransferase [Pseudomonadota bacterium]
MTSDFQSVCRLCGGEQLSPAFTLDTQNAWVFCGDHHGEGGCGMLQRATRGSEELGGMGVNLSWAEQYRLRDVVGGVLEMISTREGTALDLGCGDGDLLGAYPRWVSPVGLDARLSGNGNADWGTGIAGSLLEPESMARLRAEASSGYDVITAIGYLEAQNDPKAIFAAANELLTDDGVFVVETPYAALALTRNLTSAFHAGANAIYSLATLDKLAREAGFRIIRGTMTERAAGSIRLYMVHEDYRGHDYEPWLEHLARLWDEETSLALSGRQACNAYMMRLRGLHRDIAALKDSMLRADEHAYVLGTCAPTFATLSAADFGYDIISAHIGATAREGFPEVITEDMAREAPADVLIAPSWRRRECLERWYDQIMDGMRLVFLEPELVVVDRDNYAAELGRALAVTDGPGSVETLRAALAAMRGPGLRLVSQTA